MRAALQVLEGWVESIKLYKQENYLVMYISVSESCLKNTNTINSRILVSM